MTDLEPPANLRCVFLDCGNKPGMQAQGEHAQFDILLGIRQQIQALHHLIHVFIMQRATFKTASL